MEPDQILKPVLPLTAVLAAVFLAYQGAGPVEEPAGNDTVSHYLIDGHRGECYPFSRELKGKNISFDICINEDGLRDRSYPVEKGENTYRIIALGDWITFGWVENDENWPYLLEQRLNSPGEVEEDVEVLNFGRSGLNTYQEVELLERKGLKYSPDLVILQFMDNDLKNQTKVTQLTLDRLNKSRENVKPEEFREMARKVYAELRRERMQQPKEEQLEPVIESLDRMDRMSERHDFQVLFLYYTTYSPENYLGYLRNRTTERYGWGFMEVDLERRDRETDGNLTYMRTWDLTPQGHRAFADTIEPRVREYIR